FILDGHPVGHVQTAAPYAYPLAASPGVHFVSARATDSDGVMNTAPVRRIVVPKTPAVRVTRLVWSARLLELRLHAEPGVAVIAVVGRRHHPVNGGRLDVRVARPKQITLLLFRSGAPVSKLVLPLDSSPAVNIVNPGSDETVTGIVPVAVDAT